MLESPVEAVAEPPGPVRPTRILAIANQKGGVGKTTTAINLATALATAGEDVLLVDLDPQGNASTGLGIGQSRRERGTYTALIGEDSIAATAVATDVPNLSVLPADAELAAAELELSTLDQREYRLRQALAAASGRHSFILIDCPPSFGLLTINGLVAADAVLVPLQCEFFALEGISQLVRTIERIQQHLNPRLALQGIVLTMFDKRNNLSELVAADVRSFFGPLVYQTVIPRNVRVSEAPSHGKPVMLYDLRSPGAQAYLRLAVEVMRRERRGT